MDDNYKRKVSKFISLILRHDPSAINISLDKNGWADVDGLLKGIGNKGYKITLDDLKTIVSEDEKSRYSFSDDFTKIRANQGHSIDVDVELRKTQPPEYLFHGTGEKSLESIKQSGLKPMSRLYVHLSKDTETALKVGQRHGKPVVLKIASGEMSKNGFDFYLSENNVWLTEKVPPAYIKFE